MSMFVVVPTTGAPITFAHSVKPVPSTRLQLTWPEPPGEIVLLEIDKVLSVPEVGAATIGVVADVPALIAVMPLAFCCVVGRIWIGGGRVTGSGAGGDAIEHQRVRQDREHALRVRRDRQQKSAVGEKEIGVNATAPVVYIERDDLGQHDRAVAR